MKLWMFIKERMQNYPNQMVCENEAQMTYEELIIWAEEYAKALRGISSCAILCDSEMAASMALLACFAAGVTAIPLSKRYGDKHCNKIIETISPNAIITDSRGYLDIIILTDSQYITPPTPPALIMCTSGTTGIPKGAMLSDENIIANVIDIMDYFRIGKDDTVLIARPLYHCAVLTGEFLISLVKGAEVHFYSDHFNPSAILDRIRKNDISVLCGTPTMISLISRFIRGKRKHSLNKLCISGECMDKEMGHSIATDFPQCDIYHVYGLTEASPRVAYLPPELFADYPDYVGKPLNTVVIQVRNLEGEPCKSGEDGIVWVKGSNIMMGYYNDPERTHDVIRDGWLLTGDLGVINQKGLLKIKGRRDDMIIKAGMNIYPSEIEAELKKDPRVNEVVAYKLSGKFGVQIGISVVGDFSNTDEVKKLCVNVLPQYQIPSEIHLVAEIMKNGSGKKIRRAESAGV